MSVRLLVAAAENDVIGRDHELPWHLPADLRRFRSLTRGHVVVLGRITHESIVARLGRPLPGRRSVVVSRQIPAGPPVEGVDVVGSPAEAAALAEKLTAELGRPDWFVIGGATVYRELLPQVDLVDLTRVHAQVDGDVTMPAGWLDGFTVTSRELVDDDAADQSYSFVSLSRSASP